MTSPNKLVGAIEQGRFDFILVNYANTDMVGHTGYLDAAIKAVETVDDCVGRVADAVTCAGASLDRDCRSRECRADVRSGDVAATYRAHNRSGTVSCCQRAGGGARIKRRSIGRRSANSSRTVGTAATSGDDGQPFNQGRHRALRPN